MKVAGEPPINFVLSVIGHRPRSPWGLYAMDIGT